MERQRRSIAVMVICRDEADRIEPCLQSVAGWADEIVVLDSGSTDDTVSIARRYTDKVWQTDWPGYGPQRNRALQKIASEWVFVVDADERVPPELRAEIDAVLGQAELDTTLFKIPWRNYLFGEPLRHGRYTAPQARLFLHQGARYRDHQVHESLLLPVRRERTLKAALDHHSWRDYRHLQQKHVQYAWLLAQQKYAKGERGSLGFATIRFFADFLHQYFFRLSVLDGWRGALISLVLAQYGFHKYAALRTMECADRASRQTAAAMGGGKSAVTAASQAL